MPSVETLIAILEHDLPHLFERDITYDIYTSDIFFKDPVNTFKGKLNYRIIFWTLRFHGRLFFTELYFDLHSVYPANDSVIILADWTVRGKLRLPWQTHLLFNGTSTYQLRDGKIYEHVDTWDRKPSEILRQLLPPRH